MFSVSLTIAREVLIYLNENFQTSLTLDDPSATSLSRSVSIAPREQQKVSRNSYVPINKKIIPSIVKERKISY